MALTKRLVKGTPLTFAEGDENLDYLYGLATNTGSFITNQGPISISGSLTVTGSCTVTGSFAIELVNAEDDAAAASAGVPVGGLYRSGNFVLIRLV